MTERPHNVLLTGATGFVGRHLHPALLDAGFEVYGASRSPERARQQFPGRHFRRVELDEPPSIAEALRGCDAAVYLVHGMASNEGDYEANERRMAAGFLAAAERAGLRRIVYLGGIRPTGRASKHLRSRLATGEVLRSGSVASIELQASMIVGAESESWRIVRDLALRLPVMVLPRWLHSRTQPIAIDDVVFALTRALELELEPGEHRVEALPGPEILSGREILERVAGLRGMHPMIVEVPVLSPRLSSYWISLVTRADGRVARELVEGLTCDLVAADRGFWSRYPDRVLISFDAAARQALALGQEQLSVPARAVELAIRAGTRALEASTRALGAWLRPG